MSREQSPTALAPVTDFVSWEELIRPIVGLTVNKLVRMKDHGGGEESCRLGTAVTADSNEIHLIIRTTGQSVKIARDSIAASEILSFAPGGVAGILGSSASRAASRPESIVPPPKSPWQRMVDSFAGKPCQAKYRVARGSTVTSVRLMQAPGTHTFVVFFEKISYVLVQFEE
jgi:hypothetical protein